MWGTLSLVPLEVSRRIQTMPDKGWFTVRLYSPLEPFFTKEWRLSEIALVR
jgi:hypothetical protein